MHPDTQRLNWLEMMARNGGIFLYNGVDVPRERATAVGIGLRPGKVDRTLREGIDAALPKHWMLTTGEVEPIRVNEDGSAFEE